MAGGETKIVVNGVAWYDSHGNIWYDVSHITTTMTGVKPVGQVVRAGGDPSKVGEVDSSQ